MEPRFTDLLDDYIDARAKYQEMLERTADEYAAGGAIYLLALDNARMIMQYAAKNLNAAFNATREQQ